MVFSAIFRNTVLSHTATISNPLSTVTRFYIHSAYYLVILYSFRNLCRD
ncbi:hypothetical protein E2C01_034281 [Portunus trituberculatus]|uniref:Uncharacterized protein n=1 Tax=Portunus trituberculatus TaxID=210409 RepID=A0A5B7F559_PORTR|nr:hypothetical protein [Portunus trituberculatus]